MRTFMEILVYIANVIGLGLNSYCIVHLWNHYDISRHVYCELFVNSIISDIYVFSNILIHTSTFIWTQSEIPCKLWLLFGMAGAIAIPCITSCISVTRYMVSTKLTPPKNQTILKWFCVALIGIFGCIGLLITFYLTLDSIELKTFCGIIHASKNTEPPDLSKLKWATSFMPALLIFGGACVAFVSDLHMKWFVDKHIQMLNQGNLGDHHADLTNAVPVRATQISLTYLLSCFVATGAFFGLGVFGFEFAVLMTAVVIASHVPVITFLTFKAHNSPTPGSVADSNDFNNFMDIVDKMQKPDDDTAMTEASKSNLPDSVIEHDDVFEDPNKKSKKKTELVTVLNMINEGLEKDQKQERRRHTVIKSSSVS